ncbi:MAG: hypothetical protein PVF26_19690, partial [Desulfobacterales bacterium]
MAEALKSLGICLGASTISLAQLKRDPTDRSSGSPQQDPKPSLMDYAVYPHEGNPKQTLLKAFEQL